MIENHDDVIKWKHFPRYWPIVWGIHRSPVNSPHKGQWRGALMFSVICAWINGWANNREAGDLRRRRDHYDVIVMLLHTLQLICSTIMLNNFTHQWSLSEIHIITGTSWGARWRLKSPAWRLFAQPFVQAQIKINIKAPRHWPLWGESTGDRWTQGQ